MAPRGGRRGKARLLPEAAGTQRRGDGCDHCRNEESARSPAGGLHAAIHAAHARGENSSSPVGASGDIIALRAAVFGWEPSADWFYDKSKGGGRHPGYHDPFRGPVDLARRQPARGSRARAERTYWKARRRHESPDNASVQFLHGNGASSQIFVSWTTGYGDFLYEIYGSKGTISVNFLERQITSVFFKERQASGSMTMWRGGTA